MTMLNKFGRKINSAVAFGRKASHKLQAFGRKVNSFSRKGIHTLEAAARYAAPAVAGIAPEALPVLSGVESTLRKVDRSRQRAARSILR